MFTKLDSKINSYLVNKDNKHPIFVARNGIQEIIDDVELELVKALPQGAGIDYKWKLEHKGNLIFDCYNSYHAMDGTGTYCGIIDFTVTFNVLTKEFDVKINEEQAKEITDNYKVTEEDDSFDDFAPYFDDLADFLYQEVEGSLEYYYITETLKFIKDHPTYKELAKEIILS